MTKDKKDGKDKGGSKFDFDGTVNKLKDIYSGKTVKHNQFVNSVAKVLLDALEKRDAKGEPTGEYKEKLDKDSAGKVIEAMGEQGIYHVMRHIYKWSQKTMDDVIGMYKGNKELSPWLFEKFSGLDMKKMGDELSSIDNVTAMAASQYAPLFLQTYIQEQAAEYKSKLDNPETVKHLHDAMKEKKIKVGSGTKGVLDGLEKYILGDKAA